MRNILLLLFIFFIVGCTLPLLQKCDLENLVKEVHNKIEYKSDGENKDFWQYPYETSTLRTGDCEDMAILFIDLAHKRYGVTLNLLLISSPTGKGHAAVLYEGIVYDPTWNEVIGLSDLCDSGYKIDKIIPYNNIPFYFIFKRIK